mmetsp:Transcript_12917/g.24597  ORF Transcript_12917/g.24597 Transcript_12917/m.24597 type:complete len:170 (-) Transcript_12917:306-815(-)
MQVKQQLERRYPNINVVGSNYPPDSNKVAIAQLTQFGMFGVIGLTIAGSQVWPALGMEPPGWYHSMASNKMTTCMGAWFVGNTIAQNMLSTGAFEIYYDGQLVFSKLKTGRLPQIPSIMVAMDEAINNSGRLSHGTAANSQDRLPRRNIPAGGKRLPVDNELEDEEDVF